MASSGHRTKTKPATSLFSTVLSTPPRPYLLSVKIFAANWYRKPAMQDYASAQFNLGVMYDPG